MVQVDFHQLYSQRNGFEEHAILPRNVCPEKTSSFANCTMGFACPAKATMHYRDFISLIRGLILHNDSCAFQSHRFPINR